MWKRAILCAFPVTYGGYSQGEVQGKALENGRFDMLEVKAT
jgi:hypothetical protein